MIDILRQSTVGELLNLVSGGRILPFPDQRPDFKIPEPYLATSLPASTSTSEPVTRVPTSVSLRNKDSSSASSDVTATSKPPVLLALSTSTAVDSAGVVNEKLTADATLEAGPGSELVIEKPSPDTKGFTVVDWYDDNDQENPRNWSFTKRLVVNLEICLLTFSIYIGSAIYTASIPYIREEFHVSNVVATLGLSLFIEGYAIGPMFLAPIQELPSVGRNPVYIITIALFAILQIPTALSSNMAGLLVLRFLSGFLGSPALATGGATIGDVFPPQVVPFALGLWAMATTAGPVLGPIVGGFAAAANGWRWPIWELAWVSGFACIFLAFLLPETFADTILLKRARRLRKLTGNENLRSMSEIRQSEMTTANLAKEALVRPFQLMTEPAVLFINTYVGLTYAIFYLWFEAFPLVFTDIYHFKGGIAGLPFIGILVGTLLPYGIFALYLKYYLYPRFGRLMAQGLVPQPEEWLHLALIAGVMIPISLFTFGWTAQPDGSVHWIWPIIGASLYMPGIYLLFQSTLVYLPVSYPSHVASILAGNDFFRSSVAAAFPLFGRAYFHHLGIGGGSSLLAGLAILMMPCLYVLTKVGGRLRKLSKYAE